MPVTSDPPDSGFRRSSRIRGPPERYKFDKKHVYLKAKGITIKVLKVLILSPVAQYGYRYIHYLLLKTGTGTMENVIPNCSYIFKASLTHDIDTPNMGKDMTCTYMGELLEDMGKEI